jgi:hypothetical protein
MKGEKYREAYEKLAPEFALLRAVIEAREGGDAITKVGKSNRDRTSRERRKR